jgi:hypothetical protein
MEMANALAYYDTATITAVKCFIVQAQTKRGVYLPDGMGGGQLGHGDVASGLVGDERVFRRLLAVVAGGELGEVAVIVPLHLIVEHFGLARIGAGD